MNPSDTQIARMASTFAERSPFLRPTRAQAEEVWHNALQFGRDNDMLEDIEAHMASKGTLDRVCRDAWSRAREY